MVDATGSMASYIDQVKSVVQNLVTKISNKFQNFSAQFAFVGYRDYGDGADRITCLPFTINLDNFRSFVSNVKATGGADECEDVFGGLEEILKLSWSNMTRVLFHIGDAPCHGRQFYVTAGDNYPDGDTRGLNITDLMKKMSSLNIHYYFAEINSSTQKMIEEFDRELQSVQGHPIKTVMLASADDILETVATSITESIMHSKSLSLSHSGGKSKKSFIITKLPIDWTGAGMANHGVEFYETSFNGKLSELEENSISFNKIDTRMLIPSSPFASGALRFATAAILEINSSRKKIVLKESLFIDPKYNSENHIKASIESQILAGFLAKEFKKISPSQKTLRFLDIGYLRDKDTGIWYSVEEYFPEKFIKWSSNAGFINEDEYSATLDCFAHWSYQATNQFLVVTDIQGCKKEKEYVLTDPAITCPDDMERFGSTNLGIKGLNKFFETHRCNHICRHLKLKKHKAQINPDREENSLMTKIRN